MSRLIRYLLIYAQLFELVLSELGPWCLAEQDFCVRFFHLTSSDALGDSAKQVFKLIIHGDCRYQISWTFALVKQEKQAKDFGDHRKLSERTHEMQKVELIAPHWAFISCLQSGTRQGVETGTVKTHV